MVIKMNLIQLKYFNAVCTYKSVSDAASFLHISQPSLSNAIKELEKEFKVNLFSRHHRGMELTKEGETLYEMSKDLLSRAEEIQHIMNDLGNERKILRLGIPPMIASLFLPVIYKKFLSENPEIRLEIIEGGQKELINKLNDDFLDMVFLPHNKAVDSIYSSLKVTELETVCCVYEKNPLSSYNSVSPKDLKDTKLVLFNDSFFQTEEINKWFAKDKINPHIILKTEQLSTVESLVLKNIGVGFMFRHLAEDINKIVPVTLKNAPSVNISLVWKKEAYPFSAMNKFKDFVNHKIRFE